MEPLSLGGAGMDLSAGATLIVGVVVGLLAAVVMDWPMSRQPDGFVPAYIAASVVTRQPLADVRLPEAMIVHHLAGALAGLLYAVLFTGFSVEFPPLLMVVGVDLLSHLLAVAVVVGFIYAFFAHFVLPRAGGQSYEEQATAVRGQWLRSALVFGATMAVGVPAVIASLPR
ncbi:hypothetical protein EGH24_11750 [Halonotius terrestris]|uniref:Uncharacterized protein n=1 Tax=Halonotius terrestris TaxID=2487750 RepID=A0A8J8P7K5_9EURY|nr:hypothetical protein [Halonotius terrestris]TQQ79298.1 hypothetical protein EGH24_11750 [Halonotius terrestris]